MEEVETNIVRLPQMVENLPSAERKLFHRIFHLSSTTGYLNPPHSMHPWIEGYFGSVEAVRSQRMVKVTNLITMEGALFNQLRASRPMEVKEGGDLKEIIMGNVGDPFCKPTEGTPEDVFGRLKGEHSITASNVAKYDGFHGLVIFDEHDPLSFTLEGVSDALDTALGWFQAAHRQDGQARYPFFMWNCLWKSGASILHGHAQMTLTRDMHYAKVEGLRRAALGYQERYGSNYFEDLYQVHQVLGLAFERGDVRVVVYLTPIKEKETLLIAERVDDGLKEAIFLTLQCFTQRLGVSSFNLAIYLPPLAPVDEDWTGFPVLARLVDRGDPMVDTADFGAMELYAASVVASDPFRVVETLRQCLA
ncbi:MAG: hypothetical protein ACE5NP_00110 [Anaerolineae bacterium]